MEKYIFLIFEISLTIALFGTLIHRKMLYLGLILILILNIFFWKQLNLSFPKIKSILFGLAFVPLSILATGFDISLSEYNWLSDVERYSKPLLVFVLILPWVQKPISWERIILLFCSLAFIVILTSLSRYFLFEPHRVFGLPTTEKNSSGRIMNFSDVLAITIAIGIGLFFWFSSFKNKALIFFLFLLPTFLAFLLNQTRGAWLGVFAAILLVFGLLKKREKFYLIISSLIFSLLFFIFITFGFGAEKLMQRVSSISTPQKEYSVRTRLLMWQVAWKQFLEHPINGDGMMRYKQYTKKMLHKNPSLNEIERFVTPHSNLFHLLAGSGILGFLAYALLHGSIVWYFVQNAFLQKNHCIYLISITMLLAWLGVWGHGLSETNIRSPYIFPLLYLLSVISMGIIWKIQNSTNSKISNA